MQGSNAGRLMATNKEDKRYFRTDTELFGFPGARNTNKLGGGCAL